MQSWIPTSLSKSTRWLSVRQASPVSFFEAKVGKTRPYVRKQSETTAPAMCRSRKQYSLLDRVLQLGFLGTTAI